MPDLSFSENYVARLMEKFRRVQGMEGMVDVDDDGGSDNAVADPRPDALQDAPGDLLREELRAEIGELAPLAQAELVALMWTGRGDAEPQDWPSTVNDATDRRETPTEDYLLSEPLVAEHLAEGLEKFGIEVPFFADV